MRYWPHVKSRWLYISCFFNPDEEKVFRKEKKGMTLTSNHLDWPSLVMKRFTIYEKDFMWIEWLMYFIDFYTYKTVDLKIY